MVNSPKEFLTLNSTENYSIYYDNKTYNPDQCPPKSRNREYRDVSLRSGRTTFRRIRFDVVTLRVYDNDFTFTETVGAPQPYGSAGDCYNRQRRCPQGDFSINLENTGFRLKHGTIWEPYGHHVVMKESSFVSSYKSYKIFLMFQLLISIENVIARILTWSIVLCAEAGAVVVALPQILLFTWTCEKCHF